MILKKIIADFEQHPNVRWLWHWKVTVGIGVYSNLVPVIIWEWEQLSPPPWRRP